MKYASLALVVLVFLLPRYSFADSYSGPYCFEDPSITTSSNDERAYDPHNIRGTCKRVEIKNYVTLDSGLVPDYYLGAHAPICIQVDTICNQESAYSEEVWVSASTTIEVSDLYGADRDSQHGESGPTYGIAGVDKGIRTPVVVDRAFISPLAAQLNAHGESPSNLPGTSIIILNKKEVAEGFFDEDSPTARAMDQLTADRGRFLNELSWRLPTKYWVYTEDTAGYGKHIFGPKWLLAESQYAAFDPGSIPTNDDLGIRGVECGHWGLGVCDVVSPTSPLDKVDNYWVYTKKNGNLTLAWERSEYRLDDGSVKTVSASSGKVPASLLLSRTEASAASSATTAAQSQGFLVRFFTWILSWFR